MSALKKGDLAIVVGVQAPHSECNGRVVTILGPAKYHPGQLAVDFQEPWPKCLLHARSNGVCTAPRHLRRIAGPSVDVNSTEETHA